MHPRDAVAGIGRALLVTGLLVLGFVAFPLWGTGVYTARQQDRLEHDFKAQLREAARDPVPVEDALPPPPAGDAGAIIKIPRLGLEHAVVEGVSLPDLRKGPGHYPATPLPGELGNAAIAGHRTTYGAPFNRLDELEVGDAILISTLRGTYRYEVTSQRVVRPTELSVLDPTPDATLTLTTCNPKFSARQRLVITAALDADGSPPPVTPRPATGSPPTLGSEGLSGERDSKVAAALWALGAAAVGLAWWLAYRRRRRWYVLIAGAPPFLVVLFFFYAHLERLVPSNF